MNREWEPPAGGQAGSLSAFGRSFRKQYGSALAGLDDHMIALLEQLLEIPGVPDRDTRAALQRRA